MPLTEPDLQEPEMPRRSRIWDRRIALLTISAVFAAQAPLAFERDGLINLFPQ